jgi:hypothetical protein
MSASIEMKLKPWQVPNFANIEMPPGRKEDGVQALPSIPIKELSIEALNGLATGWLLDLYEKAGKPNPWELK